MKLWECKNRQRAGAGIIFIAPITHYLLPITHYLLQLTTDK
ncbi:MAG: hypothetical protein ACK5QA_15550 [Dolichospermum sp.]